MAFGLFFRCKRHWQQKQVRRGRSKAWLDARFSCVSTQYNRKCDQMARFRFNIFFICRPLPRFICHSITAHLREGRWAARPPWSPSAGAARPCTPRNAKLSSLGCAAVSAFAFAVCHCIFSYTLPATSTVLFPVRIRPSRAALLASFRSSSLHASYSAVPCLGAYDDDRFLLTNVCSV